METLFQFFQDRFPNGSKKILDILVRDIWKLDLVQDRDACKTRILQLTPGELETATQVHLSSQIKPRYRTTTEAA